MAEAPTNQFIIADSSALISLVWNADANHRRAVQGLARLEQRPCTMIVPGEVLTETINTLNKLYGYQVARETCELLQHTPPFLINPASPEILQDALRRFQQHGNGKLSLTDWVVLACADAFDTKELFAFDEPMGRRGYTILPPEEVQEAA